ncbi:PhaM family polyhydroxyalkanoate granule multifunctional regulatory protein [Glaciimonas sp. GG7]
MSNPTIFGVDLMSDSIDFIKKMWGGMGVPGMVVPTLSVEEIDKKIADLKAVEGWLSLNLNMLRGTIQGLEVQSATLSALQSIVAISMPKADEKPFSGFASGSPSSTTAAENPSDGTAAWAAMVSQFPFSFIPETTKTADEVTPKSEAAPIVASAPPREADSVPDKTTETQVPSATAGAWWDALQSQFKQVVSSVMAAEATQTKDASEALKPSAKPEPALKSKGATVKARAQANPKTSTTTATKASRKVAVKPAAARAKKVTPK